MYLQNIDLESLDRGKAAFMVRQLEEQRDTIEKRIEDVEREVPRHGSAAEQAEALRTMRRDRGQLRVDLAEVDAQIEFIRSHLDHIEAPGRAAPTA